MGTSVKAVVDVAINVGNFHLNDFKASLKYFCGLENVTTDITKAEPTMEVEAMAYKPIKITDSVVVPGGDVQVSLVHSLPPFNRR